MNRRAGLVLMAAFSTNAFAFDSAKNYGSQGAYSCGKFIENAERQGDYYNGTWLAGYVTAYNRMTPNTYSILGNTDVTSALLWMKNYCTANPLRNMADAAEEFDLPRDLRTIGYLRMAPGWVES